MLSHIYNNTPNKGMFEIIILHFKHNCFNQGFGAAKKPSLRFKLRIDTQIDFYNRGILKLPTKYAEVIGQNGAYLVKIKIC